MKRLKHSFDKIPRGLSWSTPDEYIGTWQIWLKIGNRLIVGFSPDCGPKLWICTTRAHLMYRPLDRDEPLFICERCGRDTYDKRIPSYCKGGWRWFIWKRRLDSIPPGWHTA